MLSYLAILFLKHAFGTIILQLIENSELTLPNELQSTSCWSILQGRAVYTG